MSIERRPRHSRHFYQVLRDLETLQETPGNCAQLAIMSDVLTAWAMLEENPSTAAPRLYRAVCDAWEDNRLELGPDWISNSSERLAVSYHTAFLLKHGQLCARPLPVWLGESSNLLEVERSMMGVLMQMRSRIPSAPSRKARAIYYGPLQLVRGKGGADVADI
jgi:hypothetical protein